MLPVGGCPLYDGQAALHRCASHKVESPIRGRAKVENRSVRTMYPDMTTLFLYTTLGVNV